MPNNHPILSIFRGVWRTLDVFRRLLHLGLLLALLLVVVALLAPEIPMVPDRAALVIAPRGALVEQLDGDAVTRAWDEVTGTGVPQTLVRDVIDALAAARTDPRIGAVLLDLDEMGGAGLGTLQDIGAELRLFRESGKPVIASGSFFTQNQYLLAAHADEIYLHPLGFVFIEGYGRYQSYYKEAIDKLLIDWNVFRVGEYKSFVEPFTRNDMSAEARENTQVWLDALWDAYQSALSNARQLDAGAVGRYTQRFVELLRETEGDLARLALETGLVDALWNPDQIETRLRDLVGPPTDEEKSGFSRVDHHVYVRDARRSRDRESEHRVGVIVAAGEIFPGQQPPGTIGSESTIELIRQARDDDSVAAVVLRVNSPGGSAFASELIYRELALLREQGKPVVVSMSNVAASGGYWIAMAADEIWAAPATLTGSIGVGAYFPTFQRSLDWLGINVDGVGTTPWSGEFRPDRELGQQAREILQLSIEDSYRRFLRRVAQAREMQPAHVERIARGQVWIGSDALRLGLVDELGGLDDAADAAAALAGLEDYTLRYIEKLPGFRETLAMQLASASAKLSALLPGERPMLDAGPLLRYLGGVTRELARLEQLDDPRGLYAHCFCVLD